MAGSPQLEQDAKDAGLQVAGAAAVQQRHRQAQHGNINHTLPQQVRHKCGALFLEEKCLKQTQCSTCYPRTGRQRTGTRPCPQATGCCTGLLCLCWACGQQAKYPGTQPHTLHQLPLNRPTGTVGCGRAHRCMLGTRTFILLAHLQDRPRGRQRLWTSSRAAGWAQ